MSKSSGEFLTVSLREEKGYDPLVYRMFCLGSHYRKSLVFSYEALDNTAIAYEKLVARIAALSPDDGEIDGAAVSALRATFCEAMDNDLNTSLALTAVYDALKYDTNGATKLAVIADFDSVLSLGLLAAAEKLRAESPSDSDGDAVILQLIKERADAKAAKNYARADEIRAALTEMGVTLKDTKEGTTYTKG